MNQKRYSRQILFSSIGTEGQREIRTKHVLIIGVGALGSSIAEMLCRSGIGNLTIIDRDYVEKSNLQRQQLYTEQDAKERIPKAAAAERRLMEINRECSIKSIVGEATVELLEQLAKSVDIIMDATDNMEIRMIVNDIAVKHEIPWIYGACVGSSGMSYTIVPGETPCLHCLIKSMPMTGMTCDTVGIIAPTVQLVVSHQVTEALKILVGDKASLRGTFLTFDLWKNEHHNIKVNRVKREDCPTCGENPTYPFLKKENQTKTAVLCGRETVQIRPSNPKDIPFQQLEESLQKKGYTVRQNQFLLSVQLEANRVVLFKDGRALIHETNDVVYAKTLYDQLLG
ncbi:ThiF family adenylyltransferase [Cytobacillus oceanisediminis]|uniref:Thiamine biosynthesis protein MoeB n=1 Tax=Niallia alba TaxID=2729105 RepID=A0A7Y0KCU0_9BACI|nr:MULTISPECIES: MoeB/ThiF family adenylyltransferase [Bacillaceae]MBZ9536645.1 ThiF family adenylyltransferase [Cytobacillus oceanisediminis]NMO79768.1 thiamine biosynthesis protein MoeB [Niallia alba]